MKNLLVEMKHGIYPCKIFCAVNCDKGYLEGIFDGDFSIGEESYAKCVYCSMREGNFNSVIIMCPNINIIPIKEFAHEASHAAIYIFDYICAKIASDCSEPFGYLVGAITEFQEKVRDYYVVGNPHFLSNYYLVNQESLKTE